MDILNISLQQQTWPTVLNDVAVTLLAKVQQPVAPSEERSITVLPTRHWLWERTMAQKIFVAKLTFLPEDHFGSVPGRSARDAAWELQSCLEEASAEGNTLAGVALDLSKAYNTFLRSFVATLALRVDGPATWWLCAWMHLPNFASSFARKLARYIHTFSTVGVPEGGPIVVLQ